MTNKINNQLEHNLQEFSILEKKFPGPAPGTLTFDFQKHKGHIVFGSIIHGNEVGPLPAILHFIKNKLLSPSNQYGGKISFILGNIEAALKNCRFIDFDLNRSFGDQFNGPAESKERKRALELMPILKSADVFFDFHQTIMPSLWPFYIFEMNKNSYYWARAAGIARAFVTRKKGKSFSNLGMCSDEYMRSLGKVGITIELGKMGFNTEAQNICSNILNRLTICMNKVFQNKTPIEFIAKKNNDFQFYSIVYREPFQASQKKLLEGFFNFQNITKNTILGIDENKNEIKSDIEGHILFPKYPERNVDGEAKLPFPGELFVIAKELKKHPLNWEKS